MAGRPSSYTEAIGEEAALLIACGLSLRQIADMDGMPDRSTLARWMVQNEEFAAKCARARVSQADANHEQMIDVCAQVLDGTLEAKAASVVLSSLQWRAAKLAPKKYGELLAMEVRRPSKTAEEMSDDELARIALGSGGGDSQAPGGAAVAD